MLNPVFSIKHMRHMTPIFFHTINRVRFCLCIWHIISSNSLLQLRKAVLTEVGNSVEEVNVLEWMTRTALELIGQGGLGYSFDPLTARTTNEFGDALKDLAYEISSIATAHLIDYYVPDRPYFLCSSGVSCLPITRNTYRWRSVVVLFDGSRIKTRKD